MCEVLPAFHAISGCDTTSYFFRIGKVTIFNKLVKRPDMLTLLASLGKRDKMESSEMDLITEFIRTVIYNGAARENYIETRIRMYQSLERKTSMGILPDPDSIIQVIKRAHLQARVWYQYREQTMRHLPMSCMGWLVSEEEIQPLWFIGLQLPPSAASKRKKKKKSQESVTEADDEGSDK